jgi:hypothetical protein
MNGKLWVDEFVTHHRDLKEINEGFDDMHVSRGHFEMSIRPNRFAGRLLMDRFWDRCTVWKLHPMCRRHDQDLDRRGEGSESRLYRYLIEESKNKGRE